MDISRLLTDAIMKSGLTITEISKRSGITRQHIYSIMNEKKNLSYSTFEALCKALNINPSELCDKKAQQDAFKNRIPVFGTIPAGIPTEMIDSSYIEDYEEITDEMVNSGSIFFGLKVKGDSMFPEFKNGDTLIIKKQDNCENGDFCAVSINHTESTFKKVIKKDNGITLQPINPNYEPIFFSNDEIISLPIKILGVVKEVRRSY